MKHSNFHIIRSHFLIIVIFGFLISTPLIISIVFKKENEQFTLTRLRDFPKDYQKYFEETFGLRKQLITAFYFIRIKILKETFVNNKIITGKDGWLYYSSLGDGITIDDFEGKIKLSKGELNKIKNNLEEQAEWLKKKNIKYLVVICPNKQTIYPENLPGSIKKGRTILDQIQFYLKTNSKIQILDLRKVLLNNKKKYSSDLYYKTDTHWNSLGAFLSYQEIIRNLGKTDPLTLSDFIIKEEKINGRDITDMIGMEKFYTDNQITFKKYSKSTPEKMKSLVVFNDSYYYYMEPFLKNNFDTIVDRPHFWSSFDCNVINEIKPEVVIYQMTERFEKQLLRDNPEEIKKAVSQLP